MVCDPDYGNAAAAEELACVPRGGCSHLVSESDTLWHIAEGVYGDGTLWTAIVDANPIEVQPGHVILVGTTLIVPMRSVDSDVCAEVDPAATNPAMTPQDYFADLIFSGQLVEAQVFLSMSPPERLVGVEEIAGLTGAILAGMVLSDAVFLLETLGIDVWPAMIAEGELLFADADTTCDPTISRLLQEDPTRIFDVGRILLDPARYANFLAGYEIPIEYRVEASGFDMYGQVCGEGSADFDLLVRVLENADAPIRSFVLLGIREQGLWQDMLGQLSSAHIPIVQGWLGSDLADTGDQTLEQRIAAAHNDARGTAALAKVDTVASTDTNDPPRITPAIRDLLAMGVADVALEGVDVQSEGILGVQSAERAAEALVAMPAEEYLRTAMLLTLTGEDAQRTQSYLILEAVAARADRFADADADNDNVAEIEGFSDDIRDMDRTGAVTATSVTATADGGTGLQQQFGMSCAPTSGVVMRASADPIEAMRVRESGMSVTDAGGYSAGETEASLERHPRNIAQLRPEASGSLTGDVNTALVALAGTMPADELQAVRNYMSGAAFDQGKYDDGIEKVRDNLARDGYPNDQAMRLLRETNTAPAGNSRGMNAGEISAEYNDDAGLNVDENTGATFSNNRDATLGGYRGTLVNGNYPAALPNNIRTQVDALLASAASDLVAGKDVGFGVLWSGGGGHAMSFINVRGSGAGRSFLVHDTWSGSTAWVAQSDLRNANLPGITGNRGLIYRLADPQ